MNVHLICGQTISLFGMEIPLYGTMIAIGMLLGVVCACFICKVKGYSVNIPINLALFALPCAIIGARLYYCALNGVDSFLEIFMIWKGGMAIYGGVIGGFVGILLCCKFYHYSLVQACDIAAPCLILGQAIGRIGCYFAGCCYGIEPASEALKQFPISVYINGAWHLSTFFYESFLDLLGFGLLVFVTAKTDDRGAVTAGYFVIYGTIRAVLEQFRDPAETLMLGSFRASQLLSVLLVIAGFAMIFVILIKKEKAKWTSR